MTHDDVRRAVETAIRATPSFRRSVRINYLNRILLDAIVRECTTDAKGKLKPASKAQRALKNAAHGVGRGPASRFLREGARLRGTHRIKLRGPRTSLAKAIDAIQLRSGVSGRQAQTDNRENLDDFLRNLDSDTFELFAAPGRSGSVALDMSKTQTRILLATAAKRYDVGEEEMLAAVNRSRAWLAATFGAKNVDNVRRNVYRRRS